MGERLVFESMCLDPGKRGFSYETSLLVDVDQASDFDEIVIRLTTKCNSIITQLSALGHSVAEFYVGSAAVSFIEQEEEWKNAEASNNDKAVKKAWNKSGALKKTTNHHSFSSSQASFTGFGQSSISSEKDTSQDRRSTKLSSFGSPEPLYSSPSSKSTPEARVLHTMEAAWDGLKRKNFSGLVAVARLTRSSIPRNGCGGKYSVQLLTNALVTHIHSYFMFQSFNPNFQRSSWISDAPENDLEKEYLIYLAYKIQSEQPSPKKPRRSSELQKLEIKWPFEGSVGRKRYRQTSGGSSVDSSSSSECGSPAGDVFHNLPPSVNAPHCCLPVIAGEASSLLHSPSLRLNNTTEQDNFNMDWTGWKQSKTALDSSRRRSDPDKHVSSPAAAFIPPMILRSKTRTDLTVPARRKMF